MTSSNPLRANLSQDLRPPRGTGTTKEGTAMTAHTGPVAADTLTAARDVALAALAESTGAAGYAAARDALAALTVTQLLDVAAVLAVTAARPHEVLLTTPEWWVLASHLGIEP